MAFAFRQFIIDDSRCAMKVGTDGVLLGAWAQAAGSDRSVLDLGAGSGLLSLMLAQRYGHIGVTAVEIEPEACADCRCNFDASPWRRRLTAVCGDALEYRSCQAPDLIVSNPPFFIEAQQSPDERRARARHADSLSPEAVVRYAADALSAEGSVALIFPTTLADTIIFTGEMLHLKERRRLDVCMRQGRPPERTLLQLARVDGAPERSVISVRDLTGAFTDDYRRLVEPFYLRMPQS